jgi:hypothetical protein
MTVTAATGELRKRSSYTDKRGGERGVVGDRGKA